MMLNGDYFSMPTALVLHDGDTLVTDLEMVKSVTKDYWSKLYTLQDTPDVPNPWLSMPSVIDVCKRVKAEPFQWPVPSNITDSDPCCDEVIIDQCLVQKSGKNGVSKTSRTVLYPLS